MKYYINYENKLTLIDDNEYTAYLENEGFIEVSKSEYDAMNKQIEQDNSRTEHPEEFIEQIENTSEILDNNIEN